MSTRDRVLNQNKVAKLTDIGKLIRDGDSVAVGGAWLSSHPMALVRQIIRSGIKNLHVMTILGSVDIDLLVGAGCVDKLMFSFVSMEAYGLPPISGGPSRRAISNVRKSAASPSSLDSKPQGGVCRSCPTAALLVLIS